MSATFLSLEASSPGAWLTLDQLTDAIDSYDANHWQDDKPRVAAIGQPTSAKSGIVEKGYQIRSPPPNGPAQVNPAVIENSDGGRSSGVNNKRCYICNSTTHLANFHRSNKQRAPNNARVNATRISEVIQNPQLDVNTLNADDILDVMNSESVDDVIGELSHLEPTDTNVYGTSILDVSVESKNDRYVDALDFSQLHYVDVCVTGDDEVTRKVRALCDSGAEVCVIRPGLVNNTNVTRDGSVKLRGIIGSPVQAELIKLLIGLIDGSDSYLSVLCAVCEGANEELILTSEVVDRLKESCEYGICASCNIVDAGRAIEPDEKNASINNVGQADADILAQEQLSDDTLKSYWNLAKEGKGGFFIRDGILYHEEQILGHSFCQLCLPKGRRSQVLRLAHDIGGGHLGSKHTKERIRLSFFWPTLASDTRKYCQTCVSCQKRARVTYRDRVPITPIQRSEVVFDHFFMDCMGPIFNHPVRSDHQWLTAFICDAGLSEWLRTPFGMKASGATFVRAVQQVLYPLKEFTDSYVDDMAVHSNDWTSLLQHLTIFFKTIKEAGFTLNIKKLILCNVIKLILCIVIKQYNDIMYCNKTDIM